MTAKPKVLALVVALAATLLGACSSSDGNTRTIQVDGKHDEFAGTFRAFFPRDVTVKPGMTVKFHQTWTGEPHTVTMGTEVQKLIAPQMLPLVLRSKSHGVDDRNLPDDVNTAAEKFFGTLPFFFGRGGDQSGHRPALLPRLRSARGREGVPEAHPAGLHREAELLLERLHPVSRQSGQRVRDEDRR